MKVASYCRVSTEKEDQANSYEAQCRYFQDYISQNPHWELYEIYADEGISGTSTKKRTQFNRMIADARQGKFQLILTKEVSRFSRNIVDTLSFTRELKGMGVAVEFVTDHISTLDADGELRLSIMATMAQEESRRTSTRVTWGQTRQMEKGVVFGRSMLGYDIQKGKMTIEPRGAEIVRLIFQKYAVEQTGTSAIACYLTQKGYRTFGGSTKWTPAGIIKILKNEKYAGDLLQKKTYTPDYLTHQKRTNKGNVPVIFLENHHEPIISRELWNLAQSRLTQNNKNSGSNGGHSNRYVFSGKITCAQCGASFVGRMRTGKGGQKLRRWSCATAVQQGTAGCDIGKLVRDDDAMQMLKTALKSLPVDKEAITRNVTALALDAIHADAQKVTPKRLLAEISRIRQKKESVMEHYFSGDISKEDMLVMKKRYETQEQALQERLENMQNPGTAEEISCAVSALLHGDEDSEILYKMLLERLLVFKDKHTELTLAKLPLVFHFRTTA